MSINFSLVLPCYNEEENISLLYKEFSEIPLDQYRAELILVNNGSKDGTQKEIEKIIDNNKKDNINVVLLNLKKNLGYGGGISEGLKIANGDYIGWSHADLQTPLIDFFKLFKLIKNKEKVFGKGIRVNNRSYFGLISKMHEVLASIILGYNLKEINAQPKIFSKDVLKYFNNMPKKWTTLDTYAVYISLENNIDIVEMDVIFRNRVHGESKWQNNFSNFIKHIFFNIMYLVQLRFQKNK